MKEYLYLPSVRECLLTCAPHCRFCFYCYEQSASRVRLVLFVCVSLTLARANNSHTVLVLVSVVAQNGHLSASHIVRYTAPLSLMTTDNFGKFRKPRQFIHWQALSITDHVADWSSTRAKAIRHISANPDSLTSEIEDAYEETIHKLINNRLALHAVNSWHNTRVRILLNGSFCREING